MNTRKKIGMGAAALAAGTLLALSMPLSASAHVSVSATSTAAGSYTVITVSVPHGVEDQPTEVVTIDIPESIPGVTPTVNPNWLISTITSGDRIAQVIYTAKAEPLDPHHRDTFELSLRLPEGQDGDVIAFVTTQTAPDGSTVSWEGADAPAITLTAATGGDGHGPASPAPAGDDVLARSLGIAGLAVGAIGIVLAITARRSAAK